MRKTQNTGSREYFHGKPTVCKHRQKQKGKETRDINETEDKQ